MHKVKPLWGKLVTILFLGFVVLGIGCSSWALFNIWDQSHYAPLKALRIPAESVNVEPDKPLYPVRPAEGDSIGVVTIPALQQRLPIIEGTGKEELKKGIGHFAQSVLPGEKDNCVLSGIVTPYFQIWAS